MSNNYTPSKELLDSLKNYEGWHEGWKDDGKGNLTTGWGFKQTPELKRRFPKGMTRQQAEDYLVSEAIPDRLSRFQSLTPNFDKLNQHQRDALFDLFYNIGETQYSRKSLQLQEGLRTMNWDMVVNNINHGYNDTGFGGLRKRRDFERRLFSTPVSNINSNRETFISELKRQSLIQPQDNTSVVTRPILTPRKKLGGTIRKKIFSVK